MKTTIKLFAVTLFAVLFSSCTSCNQCSKGSMNEKKTVLVQESTGSKGGMNTVEKVVEVKHDCNICGSTFCPKPECCGIVSKSVLSRATGQSGTGEPPIGLIPTMKTLAP